MLKSFQLTIISKASVIKLEGSFTADPDIVSSHKIVPVTLYFYDRHKEVTIQAEMVKDAITGVGLYTNFWALTNELRKTGLISNDDTLVSEAVGISFYDKNNNTANYKPMSSKYHDELESDFID